MPPKQCVILVGGLGTRLGVLTETMPKPLLPIGNRVFLDYLIDQVCRHGFDEVVCLAGYRADEIENWTRNTSRSNLRIRTVVEPEPRGTAGALIGAKDILDEQFLLLNGDSIFDINLLDLATWRPSGAWLAAVALRTMRETGRYGVVETDGDAITAFAERPATHGEGFINGGIYHLKRRALDLIVSTPCSIERDIFPTLARQGQLRGRAYDRFFLDIGIPDAFASAQTQLPALVRRPALFLDRDGAINKDVGYTHRADQIEWVEGIFEAIKAANDSGAYVFVLTNQAGVARGLYDESAVIELHKWMNCQFMARGAHIDEFAYCPHHPTAGSGVYTCVCRCRKPAPGMLLNFGQRWPIDFSCSLVVGDEDIDLETANNAGIAAEMYTRGSMLTTIDAWLKTITQRASNDRCLNDIDAGGKPMTARHTEEKPV